MPRALPIKDFRSRRFVLVRNDFAYAPKSVQRPSDLVEKSTWRGIITLPDDVAVRTSNYHGTTLKQLDDLWSGWIECHGNVRDLMFPVMLDAGDDFQAATYTALTGFYRLSIAAIRSALELIVIGAWAQVCDKEKQFSDWRAGKSTISLGQACDGLISGASTLQTHLRVTVNDNLFDQKTPRSEGGYVRRIYDGISNFAHSRPGSTDGDMRESNGPIYVRAAFNHVAWVYFEAFALCFAITLLARPKMRVPSEVHDLFLDQNRVKSRVTRAAFQFLCDSTQR